MPDMLTQPPDQWPLKTQYWLFGPFCWSSRTGSFTSCTPHPELVMFWVALRSVFEACSNGFYHGGNSGNAVDTTVEVLQLEFLLYKRLSLQPVIWLGISVSLFFGFFIICCFKKTPCAKPWFFRWNDGHLAPLPPFMLPFLAPLLLLVEFSSHGFPTSRMCSQEGFQVKKSRSENTASEAYHGEIRCTHWGRKHTYVAHQHECCTSWTFYDIVACWISITTCWNANNYVYTYNKLWLIISIGSNMGMVRWICGIFGTCGLSKWVAWFQVPPLEKRTAPMPCQINMWSLEE